MASEWPRADVGYSSFRHAVCLGEHGSPAGCLALSPYNGPVSDQTIRAVTLDAGNTLLYCDPPPPVIYAHHLSRHGRVVGPDEVEPAFRDAWRQMQQATPPGRDRYGCYPGGERAWWGAFVREVVRRLDHPAPWRPLLEDLWTAFSAPEVWHLYDDTYRTLERLRARRLKLAVISNWDRRLPEILDRLSIAPFFDTLAVSSLEGVEKPAPDIFRRTVDRLGVASAHTLHIGDSPRDDYLGARGAGVTSVLLDRRHLFADKGYRRIERLDALFEVLESER